MLYIVPGTESKVLQDSAVPAIITEGEFKTLALCRAAEHLAAGTAVCGPRFTGRVQLARNDWESCWP
jgi:hypothetical protein